MVLTKLQSICPSKHFYWKLLLQLLFNFYYFFQAMSGNFSAALSKLHSFCPEEHSERTFSGKFRSTQPELANHQRKKSTYWERQIIFVNKAEKTRYLSSIYLINLTRNLHSRWNSILTVRLINPIWTCFDFCEPTRFPMRHTNRISYHYHHIVAF